MLYISGSILMLSLSESILQKYRMILVKIIQPFSVREEIYPTKWKICTPNIL